MHSRPTQLLLNVAHALDHAFLLVFATAVSSIAADFGLARWEDLMPYGAGAFLMFGLGSLPAGRWGDHWGRRAMMLVFFFGMGGSMLLIAATQSPWQMAIALAVMGAFASIYHPVGIPMLLQGAARPGWTIGVNGFSGNIGIACAAVVTGLLVKWVGWRMAFVVPGVVAIGCGVIFALTAAREETAPAKRKASQADLPPGLLARVLLVMTLGATSASLLFNFSTNGNYELLASRMAEVTRDPAVLGLMLAGVYTLASFAQIAVGSMIDRVPMKTLYLSIVGMQVPLLLAAAYAHAWWLYAAQVLFMATIFGAIPFNDAMIVRYVDDRMRSRVAGVRLTISIGAASIAVWLLGPVVKQAGFETLLLAMAAIACITFAVILWLPPVPLPGAATPAQAAPAD